MKRGSDRIATYLTIHSPTKFLWGHKKTGSVGRFYFFLLKLQNSSFPSSPKKYRQCHQAVDPGDMYYGRAFINIGKSRGPRTLPKGTP